MAQGCYAYFGFRALGFRGFRMEGFEFAFFKAEQWEQGHRMAQATFPSSAC